MTTTTNPGSRAQRLRTSSVPSLAVGFLVAFVAGAGWAAGVGTDARTAPQEASLAAGAQGERIGPGPVPVDAFHPDRDTPVEAAWGGTVTVHTSSLPSGLNTLLVNSSVARDMMNETHAFLVCRDWEEWTFEPELATGWEVADRLVTADGRTLQGTVGEADGKTTLDTTSVRTPGEGGDDGGGVLRFEPDEVAGVERGTVVTFTLREGVRWHDGHPFDIEDVLFTWRLRDQLDVRCDWLRPYLQKIESAEALDERTVRFVFGEQYFNSFALFADNYIILPRHLYDLTDPDHASYAPEADAAARAKEINENVHNTEWVGLGPYRVTGYSQQGVEAERFDGYWDLDGGGYVDRIVWRHIASDEAGFQALLAQELDFTLRIGSDRYFGPSMASETFTRNFVKGYFYLGAFNYIPWNMREPPLDDLRVRKALAHAMDMEAFVRNVANGLAVLPTGPQCYFGPSYNHDVKRLEYDLGKAEELFAEAGWYDRDGDGVIDRDGKPFEIEMLIQNGNTSAETFAQMYQESLAQVGAKLRITSVDNATYFKRVRDREYQSGMQGWSVDVTENDPEQLWGSASAAPGGSNHAGVIDDYVDELIARGQKELDDETRWAIWRELHRYLYEEVQPYLYREAPPRKFALARALRGVQFFKITPGYSLRRWYYPAGTPGTRPQREKR